MQVKKLFLTSISSSTNTMITIEHLILLGKPFKVICRQSVYHIVIETMSLARTMKHSGLPANSADF